MCEASIIVSKSMLNQFYAAIDKDRIHTIAPWNMQIEGKEELWNLNQSKWPWQTE